MPTPPGITHAGDTSSTGTRSHGSCCLPPYRTQGWTFVGSSHTQEADQCAYLRCLQGNKVPQLSAPRSAAYRPRSSAGSVRLPASGPGYRTSQRPEEGLRRLLQPSRRERVFRFVVAVIGSSPGLGRTGADPLSLGLKAPRKCHLTRSFPSSRAPSVARCGTRLAGLPN